MPLGNDLSRRASAHRHGGLGACPQRPNLLTGAFPYIALVAWYSCAVAREQNVHWDSPPTTLQPSV